MFLGFWLWQNPSKTEEEGRQLLMEEDMSLREGMGDGLTIEKS